MENTIGARLRAFRLRTGRKMETISIATGIKTDTLYKWEKGTRPSNISEYNSLLNYLNKLEGVSENWQINSEPGSAPQATFMPTTVRLRLSNTSPAIFANSTNAAQGAIVFVDKEPEMLLDFIQVPCLGQVEGLVNVEGDSMSPTFENGSKAVIQRLNDPSLLNWGQCYYLVDRNLTGILRRLVLGQQDDTIILKADNMDQEKYPPITRTLDQILAIFRAMAELVRR